MILGMSEIKTNIKIEDNNASFSASDLLSQTSKLNEPKHGQFVSMKQFEKANKEHSAL
jgi:hypothetical protein